MKECIGYVRGSITLALTIVLTPAVPYATACFFCRPANANHVAKQDADQYSGERPLSQLDSNSGDTNDGFCLFFCPENIWKI